MEQKEIILQRPVEPVSFFGTSSETVLFVIDTLEIGGTELSLLDNLSRFRKIRPVVCHLYKGDTLKERFQEKGIRVYSGAIQKKYGLPDAYRQLAKVIRAEKPGLIVAYLTRSEIMARMAGIIFQIPVIGTFVSDLYSAAYNRSLSWKSRQGVFFFKWVNRLTAPLCCGFIANSDAVRTAANRQLGISPIRIRVINRGREGQAFRFRSRNAVDGGPTRFLNIGRLIPLKGQQDLVRAFNVFSAEYPEDILHIVGDGPLKETLSDLIRDLGLTARVFLLGARQEIPRLMDDYECFISASTSEGFSGAVIESMFAGLPVLAGNIPANREVIQHRTTGYLFRSGSVDDIIEAMRWYKAHPAAANGWADRAGEYARSHFELGKVALEMEEYLIAFKK